MQEKDKKDEGRVMRVAKKAAIVSAALGVGLVIAGKVIEYGDVREALGFVEGYGAAVADLPDKIEVKRPVHVNEFRRTSKLGKPHTVSAYARRQQVHQPLRVAA
ncbi:MAG: hypothetical protein M3134_07040 [Actinomycetota bacterium]|nr:hypothetical protein [Actinomycetota bacterium]